MTQRKPYRNTNARTPKILKLATATFMCLFLLLPALNAQKQLPAILLTRFPFKTLSGGIIVIRATVGDKTDSLNFVLDTGSGGISLDSLTVQFLRLPPVESDRTIRGIAGVRRVKYVTNLSLNLPDLRVEHLDFHISDYDILTTVYGIRIDGIVGFSFLNRYIVKINYDTNMIEVWEPGTIKYPRNGFILKPEIKSIPVLKATVTDEVKTEGGFYFDTGAGLCLLLSEDYVSDYKIFKKGKKLTTTQAEGLGGKKKMNITIVKQVRFGPYKFRKVPTHVFFDEYNVTSYPLLGGLIGNDLLRRFNLVINYGENEIHLQPNSHFGESFDYSYTGMGVYYVNGEVIIEDVLKGSPAEAAGLQAGDKIMAIGKDFSNNIQAYKSLLQSAGSKLKLFVIRNGDIIEVNLKVKSIL